MNKKLVIIGAILLVSSTAFVAYAVIVQFPQTDGCVWGSWVTSFGTIVGYNCPMGTSGSQIVQTLPRTSEPYFSYGILFALVTLAITVIGLITPRKASEIVGETTTATPLASSKGLSQK
jgi:hypothetical protein